MVTLRAEDSSQLDRYRALCIGTASVWRHEAIFLAAALAVALFWTLR